MTMTPHDDVSAIATLIAKTAYLTDEALIEDYGLVWSQDAVLVHESDTRQGLAEIRAQAAQLRDSGTLGPGSGLRHLVTPVSIEVDGDTASAVTYIQVLATKGPQPALVFFSLYDDEFVRSPDGWRIKHRNLRGAQQ
jgi:hypothetical protein